MYNKYMYYSKKDKVKIILDIIYKLKNFPSTTGSTINIYNDQYLFYSRFKEITNKWINEHYSSFKGEINFEELATHFEYFFPGKKNEEVIFVLCKK